MKNRWGEKNKIVNNSLNNILNKKDNNSLTIEIENEIVFENTGGAGENDFYQKWHGPTISEVERVFIQQGGTEEMGLLFFNKHSSSQWMDQYHKPLRNWIFLVKNFIINYQNNNKKNGTSIIKNGISKISSHIDYSTSI